MNHEHRSAEFEHAFTVGGKPAPEDAHNWPAAPPTPLSPPPLEAKAPSKAAQRSQWLVGGALIGLFAMGAWAMRASRVAGQPHAPPTASAPAPAPPSTSFSLEIAASPLGATVYEGETRLGSTPLTITVESASVSQAPRTFTVRKAGCAPYTIVQSASHQDAHVLAELSPLPSAARPTSPVRPKRAAEVQAPSVKGKPASSAADIFMHR